MSIVGNKKILLNNHLQSPEMGSLLMGIDRAATYSCTVYAQNSCIWWLQGGSGDVSKHRGRKFQAVWNVPHGVSTGQSLRTHVWMQR